MHPSTNLSSWSRGVGLRVCGGWWVSGNTPLFESEEFGTSNSWTSSWGSRHPDFQARVGCQGQRPVILLCAGFCTEFGAVLGINYSWAILSLLQSAATYVTVYLVLNPLFCTRTWFPKVVFGIFNVNSAPTIHGLVFFFSLCSCALHSVSVHFLLCWEW